MENQTESQSIHLKTAARKRERNHLILNMILRKATYSGEILKREASWLLAYVQRLSGSLSQHEDNFLLFSYSSTDIIRLESRNLKSSSVQYKELKLLF